MLLVFPSVKALLSFLILLYYQQNLPRVRNHTAHPALISAKSRQHWMLSLQYPKHRSEKLPVAIPFLFYFFPLHFTKKQQQLQEQLSGRVLYMLTWKLISNSNPNQQAVKKAIVSQVQQTFLPHQQSRDIVLSKILLSQQVGGQLPPRYQHFHLQSRHDTFFSFFKGAIFC